MKLRAVLILATILLGGMLLSGMVLAVTKHCSKNCVGTNGPDYLIGSGSTNTLSGLGGGDTLKGLRRGDLLNGGGGDDDLFGGAGDDSIYGGTGYDVLHGQKNDDYLKDIENRSASYSTARKKQRTVDVLIGDRGNDTIKANDGKRDIVRGGPGHDTAYVDRVDKVKGVEEEVVPGSGPGPNKPPVANNDSYSVYNDEYLTVTDSAKGVLSNDTDADNPNNTNAGLTVKDANPNTPEIDPVNGPTEGDLTLNTDGTFEYNHTGGCSPQPACIPPADSFTYKATDGAADSNVATVKITVCDKNDPNNPPRCTKSPPPP